MKIVITEQQYGFLVNEDFAKPLDKDEKIKEIIDYISQFDSLKDLIKSPQYAGIDSYIRRNLKNDPNYNWEKLTEPLREKEKEKKLKEYIDYISQFDNYTDFYDSPNFRNIKSFIEKNYDDDPDYNWAAITSNLKKVRKKPRLDSLEITTKDLSGSIKRIIDYISQFKTLMEFRSSPEYTRIYRFIDKNFRNDERYNWNTLTSDLEKTGNRYIPGSKEGIFPIKDKEGSIKRAIDIISKYDSIKDLKNDPMYSPMISFFTNHLQNDPDYNWKKLTSHMVKGVDKEKRLKEIIDYISQFNNYSDLVKSPKYSVHKNFLDTNFREHPDYSWEQLTGHLRNKKNNTKLDQIIDFINKFNTLKEFKDSFAYDTIKDYINTNFKDHPDYNWENLISNMVRGGVDKEKRVKEIVDKEKRVEEIIDDLSQFETYSDLVKSPKYHVYKKFLDTYFTNHPDYNWDKITEPLREKGKTKKLMDYIDYIQQFKTLRDFISSPKYGKIKNFLDKYYKNDPLYSYGSLISNLKRMVKIDSPDKLYLSASKTPKDSIQRVGKEIKDYINKFKSLNSFRNSLSYNTIKNYINSNFKNHPDYNWEKIIEPLKNKKP